MKVRITARARSHVRSRQAWWAQHRPAAVPLFYEELEQVLHLGNPADNPATQVLDVLGVAAPLDAGREVGASGLQGAEPARPHARRVRAGKRGGVEQRQPLTEATVRFPIRFDAAYRAVSTALLLTPSNSFVEVEGDRVAVRMAWGFRTRFPRSAVVSVTEHHGKPLSRGVHGWAGRWLVNGSGDGIVNIALEPSQRGWVMAFPVRLRTLLVSVEDPAGLMAALTR